MLEQRILDFYQAFSRHDTRVCLVETCSLTPRDIDTLWELFRDHHTITHDEFLARCREKCEITALFRHRHTDALIGFMGVRHREITISTGERVSTLYFGHGFISPSHRGQHLIQRTVVALYLKCLLRRPTQRVFLWSNALTVRPYLLTARDLQEYYPHPFIDWPDDVREVRDQLGHHYYGQDFDIEHGVVHKSTRYVRQHALHIHPDKQRDPHVQLYMTLNPGYERGHGLLTMQPATLANLKFYIQRRSARRLTPSPSPSTPSRGVSS